MSVVRFEDGVRVLAEEYFAPGHRACMGCGEALAVRLVCKALGRDEIVSSPLPWTSWIHTLFENVGAVVSGIESAYKAMLQKGKSWSWGAG